KNLDTNHDDRDVWLLPLQAGGGADSAGEGRSPKGGALAARQFTRNGHSEHARWSPDGKRLLIVRDGQLWLYALEGGDPVQLTKLSSGADAGIFSPDGRFIAFTSDVYPECGGDDGCNKQKADEHEKSGVKARIVDHLFARHWTEWKEGKRTHVLVMPTAGGPARDVTPLDSDWPSWRLGGGDDFK